MPSPSPEKANSDKRGRVARYQGGNIYWTSTTGAHEVHGAILTEFANQAGVNGVLKYPTSDTLTTSDKKARYSNFENGRIYYRGSAGTFTVPKPYFAKHESIGGVHGILGYPDSPSAPRPTRRAATRTTRGGRIYVQGTRVVEIHGAVFTCHEDVDGVHGPLGYPVADLGPAGDGRGKGQWFEKGFIWYSTTTGAHALWGKVNQRFLDNGNVKGYLKYPTSDVQDVGDGRGTYATFERGNIYASTTTGGFEVHGCGAHRLPRHLRRPAGVARLPPLRARPGRHRRRPVPAVRARPAAVHQRRNRRPRSLIAAVPHPGNGLRAVPQRPVRLVALRV